MATQTREPRIVEPGGIDVRCGHCKHYAMFHLDSGCTFRESGTVEHGSHICECDRPIDAIVKRRKHASKNPVGELFLQGA